MQSSRVPKPTRCYYEVLELDVSNSKQLTADDVKSAYRRAVLQWHPDKNAHRLQEATERFKEIQNAYAILSDANERAWYDNHRESILRGTAVGADADDGGAPGNGEDPHAINLWPYFAANCFSGFDDSDEEGFYAVYGRLFAQLKALEPDVSAQASAELPPFGNSRSPYADVKHFYTQWREFVTVQPFGWAERYNLAAAPNRNVRKQMERENKKRRDERRRAYNGLVRQLVEFVQKWDPRVATGATEELRLREAKFAQLEQLRKTQLAAKRAEQEAKRKAWLEQQRKQGNVDLNADDAQDDADDDEEDDEEVAATEYYCATCKKRFKKEAQWKNHEQSRRHKETVAALRSEVFVPGDERVVEQMAQLSVHDTPSSTPPPPPSSATRGVAEAISSSDQSRPDNKPSAKKKKKKKKKPKDEAPASDEDDGDLLQFASMMKPQSQKEQEENAGEEEVEEDQTEHRPDDAAPSQRRRRRRRATPASSSSLAASSSCICNCCEEEFATRNQLFSHLKATGHARAKE